MNKDAIYIATDAQIFAHPHLIRMPLNYAPLAGKRMLFVADIHMRRGAKYPEYLDRLMQVIESLSPDLVLWGGDYAEQGGHKPMFSRVKDFHPPMGMLGVVGNNDLECYENNIDALIQMANGAGIRLLINQSYRMPLAQGSLLILGIDDEKAGNPDLSLLKTPAEPNEYRILLAHSPLSLDRLPQDQSSPPQLILCGHTHGGQISVGPINPYAIGYERTKNLRNFHVTGTHQIGESLLIVTNGIGTSTIPLRVGAPPQLHLFEFTATS